MRPDFKEYIFGMLFLKRASDQFDAIKERLVAEQVAAGKEREAAGVVSHTSSGISWGTAENRRGHRRAG
jgi:type I restriction-modification system DNA methylase subunit